MTTKHEHCESLYACGECDSCLAGYEECAFDPTLDEETEAREESLRNEGAKDALDELKLFLMHCAVDDRMTQEFHGLKWAIDAIDRRLSDLTEGGAA